jgi:S1-C subfamily serine protease
MTVEARLQRVEICLWLIPLTGTALTIGASLLLLDPPPRHRAPHKVYEASQSPGFTLAASPLGRGQLVVTSLQSNGAADRAGLRVGDRLTGVNRHLVSSVREADRYITANRRSSVRLRIVRDHKVRSIFLPQPAR